jgi:hypothetical protein
MSGEGITESLPGVLLKSPSSEVPKNYFRNVEAEGSNPFTSTRELATERVRRALRRDRSPASRQVESQPVVYNPLS